MHRTYTKTTRNKQEHPKKDKKKKGKGTKWDILASECERMSIFEIYNEYKPRMKTASMKELADRVYSDYICIISSNKEGFVECCTCGKQGGRSDPQMQDWHYRSRWHLLTRYMDSNNHVQCYVCNVIKKGNYRQYHLFMVKKYGAEHEDRLWNNEEQKKIKNYEYAEMIQWRYDVIQIKRKQIECS